MVRGPRLSRPLWTQPFWKTFSRQQRHGLGFKHHFWRTPTVDGVYIATEMASKAFTDMTLKLIHEWKRKFSACLLLSGRECRALCKKNVHFSGSLHSSVCYITNTRVISSYFFGYGHCQGEGNILARRKWGSTGGAAVILPKKFISCKGRVRIWSLQVFLAFMSGSRKVSSGRKGRQ